MQWNGSENSSRAATLRLETLTAETSGMSAPATSRATINATSSPASAAGAEPSDLPDGQIIDLFGQAVALVSRSAPQAAAKALPMTGTYGRIGSVSSASERLQSSLESRLRERLGTSGLTPLPMTWKRLRTPRGRSYSRLALSGRHTSETDFGLLPTPAAQSYGTNIGGAAGRTGKVRPSLEHMARHNLWPTPRANAEAGADFAKLDRSKTGISLLTAVRMWPTPAHRDYRYPNAKSYEERGGGKKGEQLPNAVGGALNPTWVAWLMGYPEEWVSCAPSATPSSRKSRLSSSRALPKSA
jgi:hypothetical protein